MTIECLMKTLMPYASTELFIRGYIAKRDLCYVAISSVSQQSKCLLSSLELDRFLLDSFPPTFRMHLQRRHWARNSKPRASLYKYVIGKFRHRDSGRLDECPLLSSINIGQDGTGTQHAGRTEIIKQACV